MSRHLIFFLFTLSALSGIVFAGFSLPLAYTIIPAAVLFILLSYFNARIWIALFASLLMILGSFYYFFDAVRYELLISRLPQIGKFEGIIASNPRREFASQSFRIKTDSGKILINTGSNPEFFYGDKIIAEGKIEPPLQNSYGKYLAKENIVGIMNSPYIKRIAQNAGNPVLGFLFRAKYYAKDSFKRFLTPEEAALLSAIAMGANEDISKSFNNKLQLAGVRHLTAINGLHMTVAVFLIFGACLYILPRRYAFIITFLSISLFTALTGFTVSGIRSALMAFLAGLAKETGRLYAPHNALAAAALFLALINPKVPVYDAGFQLSFLAVISIIYFMPVLRRLLRMSDSPGFMKWKESLLITFSAQLATAPILIAQFGNFTLTAFLANIFVVTFLPYIMILGFFIALFSFIYPLAWFLSFIAAPFLDYVIFIVNFFARNAFTFNPSLGFTVIAVYYTFLIILMYWHYRAGAD